MEESRTQISPGDLAVGVTLVSTNLPGRIDTMSRNLPFKKGEVHKGSDVVPMGSM